MSAHHTGAAPAAPRLTPDEYMALLLERRDDYETRHPPTRPWIRALPEWFIRDGDEDLVDMDAIEDVNRRATEQPTRTPKPRNYRPASHWREKLARIDRELDALDPGPRFGTTDMAAYGGVGVPQTARQNAQWARRIDRTAERYVRLTRARDEIAGKLARAERRESA